MMALAREHRSSTLEDIAHLDISSAIFSSLSTSDLYALCLTSRGLRCAATSTLYSSIQWTWTDHQTPPIVLFLRTLLHSPGPAHHVKSIILLGNTPWGLPNGRIQPEIPTDGLPRVLANISIDRAGIPFAQEWKQELINGEMDALVALLLLHANRVRHFHADYNFTKRDKILGKLLRFALTSQGQYSLPGFQRLEVVTSKMGISDNPYCGPPHYAPRVDRTAGILPLFYLANIVRLDLDLDGAPLLRWPADAPCATQLKSLTLTAISETQLATVLSCTPALQQLRFKVCYPPADWQHNAARCVIDLAKLSEALDMVKSTLTDLDVTMYTITGVEDMESPYVDIQGTFQSLAEFTKLTTLRLPILCLTDFVADAGYNFVRRTPDAMFNFVGLMPNHLKVLTLGQDLCGFLDGLGYELEWSDTDILEDLQVWLASIDQCPQVSVVVSKSLFVNDIKDVYNQDGKLYLG